MIFFSSQSSHAHLFKMCPMVKSGLQEILLALLPYTHALLSIQLKAINGEDVMKMVFGRENHQNAVKMV